MFHNLRPGDRFCFQVAHYKLKFYDFVLTYFRPVKILWKSCGKYYITADHRRTVFDVTDWIKTHLIGMK